MSTLIEVNKFLTVTLLQESKSVSLCQNIDNGEFVVWYKGYANKGFCNGFYTFELDAAITEFNRRSFFDTKI